MLQNKSAIKLKLLKHTTKDFKILIAKTMPIKYDKIQKTSKLQHYISSAELI